VGHRATSLTGRHDPLTPEQSLPERRLITTDSRPAATRAAAVARVMTPGLQADLGGGDDEGQGGGLQHARDDCPRASD
jgi:hypothetical protein